MGRRKSKARNEAREELVADCRARLEKSEEAPEEARAEAVDAFDAMLVLVSLERKYEDEDVNMMFTRKMLDSVMAAIDRAYACGLRDGQAPR